MDRSFEVFYAATAQRTYDTVRRAAAGDKDLTHDSVQDAYVVMIEKWALRCCMELQDNQRYVIGIAMHKLADAYRQRGRFDEFDDELLQAGCLLIDGLVEAAALHQVVRDLLAAQPPKRRMVGVLHFIEDRSYADIATLLDISQSTVRTHVSKLRAGLLPLVRPLNERRGDRP